MALNADVGETGLSADNDLELGADMYRSCHDGLARRGFHLWRRQLGCATDNLSRNAFGHR